MDWFFTFSKKNMILQTFPFSSATFLIYRGTHSCTHASLHLCVSYPPFLGTTRREKHLDTMIEEKREKYLNTPSAISKSPCTGLVPRINLIMEQMDLKDDITKMSTVVRTDLLAFAKSKLGSKGFDFRVKARIRSVLHPWNYSANGTKWWVDRHLS